MPLDPEPVERWLAQQSEQKREENKLVMDSYGMELRSKILFAALNIERIANVVRNMNLGRTPQNEVTNWSFNQNIDYLFKQNLIDKIYEERFHAFRLIRNAFIHDIECKDLESFALIEPRPVPMMLKLADDALVNILVPLERSTMQKLDLGLNMIVNGIVQECGRMVEVQAKKRGR